MGRSSFNGLPALVRVGRRRDLESRQAAGGGDDFGWGGCEGGRDERDGSAALGALTRAIGTTDFG